MCLIAVAYEMNDRYPLIVLANRDEFYARPTEPLAEWPQYPGLFAGRDLQGGGTWMGMTRSGRFAAVTNYRELTATTFDSSRGHLVTGFLNGIESGSDFLTNLQETANEYAGFNLLVGDSKGLACYSNKGGRVQQLGPGIYGLSNHLLDTPWPKVERLKQALKSAINEPSPERLLPLLTNQEIAEVDHLPETGLPQDMERLLSACFIESENYGTRASNLIMVDQQGGVLMHERSFGPHGQFLNEQIHRFAVR
jgi:uncharacterized protein with NRDE domain